MRQSGGKPPHSEKGPAESRPLRFSDYFFASNFSISSITRFILRTVRSSGADVVMSTPASLSKSIGYFEPPDERKSRYFCVACLLPASTFSESAADAVNDVAYW